mgnify:CR=1 FL=1
MAVCTVNALATNKLQRQFFVCLVIAGKWNSKMRFNRRWRHARRWYTQSYAGAHCRPAYNVHTCSHLLLYRRELCIRQLTAQ